MNTFLNIILYFLIALLVLQNHLFIAFIITVLYTYRAGALWLIPLGFGIDGYFGAFSQLPLFSMLTTGWYVISESVRPRLIIQHQSYDKTS